jgi:hypothetical protein
MALRIVNSNREAPGRTIRLHMPFLLVLHVVLSSGTLWTGVCRKTHTQLPQPSGPVPSRQTFRHIHPVPHPSQVSCRGQQMDGAPHHCPPPHLIVAICQYPRSLLVPRQVLPRAAAQLSPLLCLLRPLNINSPWASPYHPNLARTLNSPFISRLRLHRIR